MKKIFIALLSMVFATNVLAAQQVLIETSTLLPGFSHGDVRTLQDENTVKSNLNNTELYSWGPTTGLELIDEGNGGGWRLIGRDPELFGNVGLNAVDLSYSSTPNTTKGATGENSYAEGVDTTSAGHSSHVEGYQNLANGNHSHAEGLGTVALNDASHAAGKYNVGTSTDTVHETGIGNGSGDKKNAFEIYSNGRLRAPELTIALHDDVKSLTTKEYVDSSYVSGSFVSGDLVSDKLTITHNFYVRALHVTVENDTGQVVLPTVQFVNSYSLTLDFTALSVTNTWYYRVSK